MMTDKPYAQALVEPGCTPGPGDWSESLVILGDQIFVHRGVKYAIGKDIPLSIAYLICRAQWIEADDRLDYAHKLFVSWMHNEVLRENHGGETGDGQIIQGTKPPGISLAFLNRMLGYIGLCLVISVNTDEDGRLTGIQTRLWLERVKKYEARAND